MKRTKMRTALAAAAALCAFCSQADVHWTNTDGSSVRYWDDTDNWDNYSAGGNWVFHRDYLFGTPVEVNFRNADSISNGIWIENNLDGLVTFKASSLDCGFENTANGVNVGTGAYGALTIDGGTYYVHNDVAVPSANNGKGVFTLDSGIVRTYYWLPIARNSGSEGTVNINGGEMVVGYRNGAEVDNGVIEIATGANSVGTLVQRGGKMRSQSAGNNPAMKLGEGGSSKASYIISNGVYNATGPIRFISAADSESLFRVAGGEVQVHEGGFEINGASGATGTVDVAGGTLAVTNRAAGGYFDVGSNEGMTGIINVGEGGTLAAAFIHLCCNKNTTSEMNVDGGTVSMTGHNHTGQDQHIRVGGAWDYNKDVEGSAAKYTQTAGTVEVQDFLVADGLNSTGTATVSGGSLTVDSDFNVASRAGAKGSFTLSGGTLTLANFHLGVGDTSCGEFVQTGGSISIPNGNNWATVGHSGSGTSSYTMTGGTFDMNANGNNGTLVVGRAGTTVGTLDVSGTASLSARIIQLGEESGATGTVNLGAGGTIASRWWTCPNGTGIVNIDGGTLKALETNNNFLPAKAGLTVNVKAGGAVIDTQGYDVIVNAPLLSGVEDGETDGGLVKVGLGQLTLPSGNTYNGLTDVREGVLVVSAGHEFAGGVRLGSHGAIAVDMTAAVDTGTIAVGNTLVVFKTPAVPVFEYANDTLEESVFLSGPVFGYTLSYDSAQGAVVATVTDVTNISSTRKVTAFVVADGYIDQDSSWSNKQPSNGSHDIVVFCGDATMSVYSGGWGDGNNRACETMAIRGATVLAQHPNDWNPCLDKNKVVGHGTLRLRRLGLQERSAPGVGVTVGENVTLDVVQTSANTDTWFEGSDGAPVIVNGDTYVTNGLMRVNSYVTFNGDIYVGGTGSLYNGGFASAEAGTVVNGKIVLVDGFSGSYANLSSPLSESAKIVLDGGSLIVALDSKFTYKSGTLHLDGSSIEEAAVGTAAVFPNATIDAEAVDVAVGNTDFNWVATVANGVLTLTAASAMDSSAPNYWIGGASGEWKVAGNWSRGVPSTAYPTQIDTDSTITLDANKTAGAIVVNGTVHFKYSTGNPNLYFNSMSGTGRVMLSHIGLIANAAETEVASTLTLEPVITSTDSWLEGQNGKLLIVRAPMVGTGYVIVRNNVRFYGDNSGFEGQFRKDDADMRFMTPESGLPNAWKTDIYGTLWLMFSDGTIQFADNSTFNAQGNHGIHLPAEPGNVVLEVGVGGGDVTFTKTGNGYRFYTENGGNWSAESAGCATATLRKVGTGTFTNNAYDTYNLDCVGGTTTLANDSTTVAVTVRDGATLKIAEDRAVGSVAFESGAKFVTTVSETTENDETVSSAAHLTVSGAAALSATEISTEGTTPDTSVRYPVISASSLSGSAVANVEDPDTTDKMVWLAKNLGSGVSLKYGRANPGFAVVIR